MTAVLAGITEQQSRPKDEDNCTSDFRKYNTLTQRLDDAERVIEFLRTSDVRWNRKLLLIGGSEGGMMAPLLATRVPETSRMVMMVAGNGRLMVDDMRDALLLSGAQNGLGKSQLDQLARQYDQTVINIQQNPFGETIYQGHTYKWWSSVLWVQPINHMLYLRIPQLLVHGTMDTSVPVLSAQMVADAFARAGKRNLIYWELPGLNHSFTDPMASVIKWKS